MVHTSDWHLGKTLYGQSLLEEQKVRLENWVQWIRDNQVTHVVIAGDIFDRAVPPESAVQLFADTVCALTEGTSLEVFLIPGNHDSRIRVGAFSALLKRSRIHIHAEPDSALQPIALRAISNGEILAQMFLFPYLEPQEWNYFLNARADSSSIDQESEAVPSHQNMLESYIGLITPQMEQAQAMNQRILLVAHLFVGGGLGSESERPLSIGGSELVHLSCLTPFDYVALGHLHRRQEFALEGDLKRACYSGSLFPYSWSEANQVKTFEYLEFDRTGLIRHQPISFQGARTLVAKRLTFDEALLEPSINDYLLLKLTDAQLPLDAARRLKQRHPGLLNVSRDLDHGSRSDAPPDSMPLIERVNSRRDKSDTELILDFAREHTESPLSDSERLILLEYWRKFQSESETHDLVPIQRADEP